MATSLNILLVENSVADAELLMSEVQRAGFDSKWTRVETETDFLAELKKRPDIVLSDYSLPEFGGLRAAKLTQDSGLDIPFILISGTVGEDIAVEAMKLGAADYLLKDRMVRLGPAIRRTLHDKQLRDDRRIAAAAKLESDAQFHQLTETQASVLNALPAYIALLDPAGVILTVNDAWRGFATANSLQGPDFFVGQNYLTICERAGNDEAQAVADGIRTVLLGAATEFSIEYPCHSPEEQRWFRLIVTPFRTAQQVGAVVMHVNITQQKQSEDERNRLFNLSLDLLCVADFDGWLKQVNPAWTECLGWTAEELTSSPVQEFILPEDREVTIDLRNRIHQGQSVRRFENRYRHKDGSYRWLAWSVHPLTESRQVFAVGRDVTQLKQAEEALRSSEQEQRQLAQQLEAERARLVAAQAVAKVGSWETDIATLVVIWSAETHRIFETDPAAFQPTHQVFLAMVHPEDRAEVDAAFSQSLGQHYPNAIEHRVQFPDGRIKFVQERWQVFHDAAGLPVRAIGTCQDITDRKRAEEAVLELQSLYHSLVDQMPGGVFRKDADGRYVFVNSWFCQLKAIQPEAMLGKLPSEVAREELRARPRKDPATAWESRLAAQGEDHHQFIMRTGQTVNVDEGYPGPDGTQRYLHAVKVPVFDPAGKVVGSQGMLFDITERKRAEAEVQWKTTLLEAQVASALDGILVVDGSNQRILQNQQLIELFHIPQEIAEDRDDARLLRYVTGQMKHPDEFLKRVEYLYQHPDEIGRDEIVLADGAILDRYSAPVRDEAGNYYGRIWAFRDITEHRKMEAQLRQSQKMEAIGQLAGGVAHDFNNILAVIQLQAGLLKSEAGLTREQLGFAGEIERAAQRASNLTRQLLLFSRQQTLQPRDFNLNEAIIDISKMLQRILGEDVQMLLKLSPSPLLLHADAGMIDQILLNLTVNARDAMPEGGQLIVETSAVEIDELTKTQSPQARAGSFVCLSVSDTGCGIPPENLSKIFNPFFTTKEVGKGTGLGLATVFGIVQQHQGWVNVYSELGQGATFRIYLPRMNRSQRVEPSGRPATSMPGGNETILLVEDDASLRSSLAAALSRLGYQVLKAATGKEALAVWQQHHNAIQLLLTDMVMPGGINGKELAQQLLKQNPRLKVIYASGYSANIASKGLVLEEGFNFIAKPFEADRLAQTVRNCLDRD